jgi:RNA-splicing ligase RtcB
VIRINQRLLSWASLLEDQAREQAIATSTLPFVHPHVALMPDAHWGMGSTVGSVIPTVGCVMPAAVGVDIGCGMAALRTQLTAGDVAERGDLAGLRLAIQDRVPVSPGVYRAELSDTATARVHLLEGAAAVQGVEPDRYSGRGRAADWRLQLGTLGGGNHFIELCFDEADRVWVFLHSGSRGVGNRIAKHHVAVAQRLCERWHVQLPHRDLAFLPQDDDAFWPYIRDLRWAQAFALENRAEMLDQVVDALAAWIEGDITAEKKILCLAGETPVITRSGTRPIETLAGGEHELLTADGEWVKAPVRSFGRQEVSEVVLSRSGVIKHIRATAEHRWLLRTRRGHGYETTTAELRPGDRLQFTFPKRPAGLRVDRRAAARGFVYGDGSRRPAGSPSCSANFYGAKDAALLPLFNGLGRPPRTYDTSVRINGLPAAWKLERPALDSPPNELYGWLAGYFAADGDVGKTGRPTLSSASLEDLEYVRQLCQVIGVGTFGIRSRMRVGRGTKPSALHLVGIMRADLDGEFFLIPTHRDRFLAGRGAAERRGWNVVDVRPTGEYTEVYCAVVEGRHSFALADNILTGNCHHNYTEQERHFGRDVWLTRKGAINAEEGRWGLIPGSMGTRSYVVTGKGNRAAFHSAPHGAGRNFSRTEARKRFSAADLTEAMVGIEWRAEDAEAFVDEIPGAYKDVDVVMADAADLVEVQHTLRQFLNVKGK